MKKLIILVLALVSIELWAGNSAFSYYGFPVRYYGRDIYSLGMGDTGSSDVFRLNSGFANPAQRNKDNKSLFGTGVSAGYTLYKSDYQGKSNTFRDDALDFPFFSLSIPVKSNRFGFQFNSLASGVVKNQTLYADSTLERQECDKYLYRADLFYSYRIKNLNLALAANYYFGHENRTFEQSSAGDTVPTRESLLQNFKNPGLSLGILQSFEKHSVGMYANLPVKLKGDSKRSSSHTSEEAEPYHFDLPLQLGLGYTSLIYPQLKASVDVDYEFYSQLEGQEKDGIKAGLGLAYEPEGEKRWYARFPMRAGFWQKQLPFVDKAQADIREQAYSFGISFPLKNKVSRVDLALQYLTRGNLDRNKLSDSSFLFMFGFTGFDIFSKALDRTAPRDIPKKEELKAW